jgi:hypothetical protein
MIAPAKDIKIPGVRKRIGKLENGEMGRWGNGEMGKWGDGEMGKWAKSLYVRGWGLFSKFLF